MDNRCCITEGTHVGPHYRIKISDFLVVCSNHKDQFEGFRLERIPTEDFCDRCDQPNPVWSTTLWIQVMGTTSGILCPSCFVLEAEKKGYGKKGWSLSQHRPPEDEEVQDLAELLKVIGVLGDQEELERIARCIIYHQRRD